MTNIVMIMSKWQTYESEKKKLPRNLSPREYEKAVREICKRLKI